MPGFHIGHPTHVYKRKKFPNKKGGPAPLGPPLNLPLSLKNCTGLMHSRGEVRYGSPNHVRLPGKKRAALLLSQRVLFSAASEHPAAGDVSLWTRPLAEGPKRRGGIRGRLFSVTLACLLPVGSFWSSHFGFLVISFDSRHCRDAGLR